MGARRTPAEVDAIDQAIIDAVAIEVPVTVHGVYYRVVSAGIVPKTLKGYRVRAGTVLPID